VVMHCTVRKMVVSHGKGGVNNGNHCWIHDHFLWIISVVAAIVVGMALMAGDYQKDLLGRGLGETCSNGSFAYIGAMVLAGSAPNRQMNF
jgi:hypothetical protein